jgi:hypothetical protein
MRYRKLDQNLDYSFGQGQGDFWINVPDAVGQYVLTRMMLWQGTWFADLTQGVPWATEVLGNRTMWTRDPIVIEAINDTPGVQDISQYNSAVDPNARTFTAAAAIDTIYGPVAVVVPTLPATVPPLPPPVAQAAALGILGGNPTPLTPVTDTPAPLTNPGRQNISEFVIQRLDPGVY